MNFDETSALIIASLVGASAALVATFVTLVMTRWLDDRRWVREREHRVEIDQARIDRQIRELALEHAAGSLGDEAYLARLKVLRQQRDAVTERTAAGLPAECWYGVRTARRRAGASACAAGA